MTSLANLDLNMKKYLKINLDVHGSAPNCVVVTVRSNACKKQCMRSGYDISKASSLISMP